VHAYTTLALPWPARDAYPSQIDRFEAIRTKYLLRGSLCPLGELIELRAFADLHKIPAALRRPIVRFCLTLDVVDATIDLALRPDGSAVLEFAPVHDGYSCHCCRFLTTSRKVIRQHLITDHNLQHPESRTKYSEVHLQSWYPPGRRSRYWITVTLADQACQALDHLPAYTSTDIESAALLETLEDQEQQRLELLEQDHTAWDAEVEDDDTTPWLQYTKWPEQFAGRPLDINNHSNCTAARSMCYGRLYLRLLERRSNCDSFG
jgi:hypothetical protein